MNGTLVFFKKPEPQILAEQVFGASVIGIFHNRLNLDLFRSAANETARRYEGRPVPNEFSILGTGNAEILMQDYTFSSENNAMEFIRHMGRIIPNIRKDGDHACALTGSAIAAVKGIEGFYELVRLAL